MELRVEGFRKGVVLCMVIRRFMVCLGSRGLKRSFWSGRFSYLSLGSKLFLILVIDSTNV